MWLHLDFEKRDLTLWPQYFGSETTAVGRLHTSQDCGMPHPCMQGVTSQLSASGSILVYGAYVSLSVFFLSLFPNFAILTRELEEAEDG